MAYFYLAFNLFEASRFREAREAAARCRAIGEAIGDPFLVSYGLFTAGWIHAVTGEWTTAVEECREAVHRSADPVSGAYSSAFLGYALVEGGQLDEGQPLLEQAVERMRQFRFPQAEALYGSQLARAHLAQGDVEAAERVAQAALATAETSYRRAVGLSQRVLGEIARARGALATAEGWLRAARETFAAIGEPFEVARTDLALGALADALGDAALAARHRAAAANALETLNLGPLARRLISAAG
jgi:tetratricopeptide (TPR) repeat protein